MATIFTRIMNGEIPCYKVAENDKFFAFLDINPVQEYHTLIVPKVEVDNIFDIDDDLLGEMMVFAKVIAKKIQQVTACRKVSVTVIGLEVPHAHIHLIPINKEGDLDFKAKKNLEPERFLEILNSLK